MPRNPKRSLGTRAYTNYKPETLQACLRAIKSEQMTQRKASEHYKIPRSTIKNKLKALHSKSVGHPTAFTPAVEVSFAQHCMKLADFGFPLIPSDLKMCVTRYLDCKGVRTSQFTDNIPGDDWIHGFLKRNKDLSVRVSANIKKSRANITTDDVNDYMDRLEQTLAGIPPSRIYNYDETNLTDDPGTKKVIGKRGSKYVERICNSSKSAISLMFCGNAEEHVLPVYVVYKAESLWTTWTEGGPPNARYNRSKSGWFDSHIFENWFVTTFLKEVQGGGPSALIGDNLASHINEHVLELCDTHDIKFICLPPNTTHISLPLDVAFFRPMKGAWRDILRQWKNTKTGSCYTTLPKDIFPRLLTQLMDKIEFKKAENLKAGFKKSGIHPVNREKLIERLAEHKSDMLDNDLIGKAFLDQIQNERQDFIGLAGKPAKKKKLQVAPGDSISIEDLRKSRDNPGPSTLKPTRNKKKGQVLSSSSSESDSMDFDLASDSDNLDDGSDSEDVDNLVEPDDGSDSEDVNNLVEPDDNLEEPEQNYKVDDLSATYLKLALKFKNSEKWNKFTPCYGISF